MTSAPSIGLAFAAGIVSFASPCTLPLVPGYLAVLSRGGRIMRRSVIFTLTFSVAFMLLGLTATALGALLLRSRTGLYTAGGVVVCAMGIWLFATPLVPALRRGWRPAPLVRAAERGSAPVAGLAFAFAWTPCVGPALGAILGLTATQRGLLHGALLLVVYSLGLAVPFLACAAGYRGTVQRLSFLHRRPGLMQSAGGLVLIGMGVLVLTNQLYVLNAVAQHALDRAHLDFFQYL